MSNTQTYFHPFRASQSDPFPVEVTYWGETFIEVLYNHDTTILHYNPSQDTYTGQLLEVNGCVHNT